MAAWKALQDWETVCLEPRNVLKDLKVIDKLLPLSVKQGGR